tara:strand:- start:324 stop:503 length:180 start_codon:yes stop_codon:yes gene_type:complete
LTGVFFYGIIIEGKQTGMGDLTLILAKHSQVLRDTLNQMEKVFKLNLCFVFLHLSEERQ